MVLPDGCLKTSTSALRIDLTSFDSMKIEKGGAKMSTELLALWFIAAWCGTPPRPRPWPWPWPWPDPPDPWPWLEVVIIKTVGVLGAVIGGVLFTQVFALEMPVTVISAAATAIGAYFGAVLFSDVYGFLRSPLTRTHLSVENQ